MHLRSSCFLTFTVLAGALAVNPALTAEPAPAAEAPAVATALTPADLAWKEIETLRDGPLSQRPRDLPSLEAVRRSQQLATELTAKLEAFYANYPTDPRRWRAVIGLRRYMPLFIAAVGPAAENPLVGAKFDEPARAAFTARLEDYEVALLAASDATAEQKRTIEAGQARRHTRAVVERGRAATRAEWEKIFAELDGFAARHRHTPEGLQAATELVNRALVAYENVFPNEAIDFWSRYTDFAEPRLAEVARTKISARQLLAAPLAIHFTAADGREVDLAKLRGKVVLVDFWATWCGPCKEEIPNVKQVYAAYHDRGFEVIGIALENPNERPGDTPAQTAAKLAAAKQKLLDFVAQHEMPWPQHFDGKWWKNEISTRYGISAIPAMFLLGRDGRIVTTDARGPKLEAEVRRLLAL